LFSLTKIILIHLFNQLFSPGLPQNGEDDDGYEGFMLSDIIKEVRRVTRLKCFYCKKRGANLGCDVSACRKVYHTNCALDNKVVFEFCHTFPTFCKDHKRIQQKEVRKLDRTCGVCFEKIDRAAWPNVLAPCCKSSWFHKNCLQQYALSAGLLFKCPFCSSTACMNKLQKMGIFFPNRDAKWEFDATIYQWDEPGIPNDIQCEHPECANNLLNSSKPHFWKMCDFCGAGAIHYNCLQNSDAFTCKSCKEIFDKSNNGKRNNNSIDNRIEGPSSSTSCNNTNTPHCARTSSCDKNNKKELISFVSDEELWDSDQSEFVPVKKKEQLKSSDPDDLKNALKDRNANEPKNKEFIKKSFVSDEEVLQSDSDDDTPIKPTMRMKKISRKRSRIIYSSSDDSDDCLEKIRLRHIRN
jgi:hypothetical protein